MPIETEVIRHNHGDAKVNDTAEHPLTEASTSTVSLDPTDWVGFREQAHRMLDDMLGYMETIREHPVWQVIPDEVRARFREDLPAKPTALAQVHAEFMTSILPFTARNAHPGFLGWVQGGGTPVGMLAEMLAAGLNANARRPRPDSSGSRKPGDRLDAHALRVSRRSDRAVRHRHVDGQPARSIGSAGCPTGLRCSAPRRRILRRRS